MNINNTESEFSSELNFTDNVNNNGVNVELIGANKELSGGSLSSSISGMRESEDIKILDSIDSSIECVLNSDNNSIEDKEFKSDDSVDLNRKYNIRDIISAVSIYCKNYFYIGSMNTEKKTVLKVNGDSIFSGSVSAESLIEKVTNVSNNYTITNKNICSYYLISETLNSINIYISNDDFPIGTKLCFKRGTKCNYDVYICVKYNKNDISNQKIEYYTGRKLTEGTNAAYIINTKGGCVSFFYTGNTWCIYSEYIGSL